MLYTVQVIDVGRDFAEGLQRLKGTLKSSLLDSELVFAEAIMNVQRVRKIIIS